MDMAPPNDEREQDGSPYFTEERQHAWGVLASVRRSLGYRTFLIQHAHDTYGKIKEGQMELGNGTDVLEEQNILRALSAQIISETYNILEGLAAISFDHELPPEDRAYNLLTYNIGDIDDFYDSYSQDTNTEFFKSILSFPEIEEVDVDASDEDYYQEVMNKTAEAYKSVYLVAQDTRSFIRDTRHKFTHGFLLAMFDRVEGWKGDRIYPEGCDDMLSTIIWDDEIKVKGLLTGERPHNAYLTVAKNANFVQQAIITQLMIQMRNSGDPVYPRIVIGGEHTPDYEPNSVPSYPSLRGAEMDISVNFHDEEIQHQLKIFDNIEMTQDLFGPVHSNRET